MSARKPVRNDCARAGAAQFANAGAACATALVAVAAAIAATGCQRSSSFRRDQNYYTAEAPSYYSKTPGKTPTQRIESLGQPKKKVVILNFWNDTPVQPKDLGEFAADELRRNLFTTQRVILPEDAKSSMSTEDFVQGDQVKVAQLIREGRRLGVSALVIGRVTKVVFRQKGDEVGLLRQRQSLAAADVELKLFDIEGGREIMASGKSGEASSNAIVAFEADNQESPEFRAELTKLAVRNAVNLLVTDVVKSVEKMTWRGQVAKITGGKIYVNAGRASGLIAGDILRVLTPGEDVFDPASGAFLGRSPGQLKGTLEVTDFLGTDGAVAEVHTGGNFQEGDHVRLY